MRNLEKAHATQTDEQRKNIFEEGRNAATLKQSRHTCPYLNDETPERNYIWMAGFDPPGCLSRYRAQGTLFPAYTDDRGIFQ